MAASPSSQFVVFDHDGNDLQKLSKEMGFIPLTTSETGDAKDEQAKELLLANTSWRIAFVHIRNGPWDDLYQKASDSKVVVRFSTEGYPPIRPMEAKALCLHCTKKISELTTDDVNALKNVLSNPDSCNGLKTSLIPHSIRHLIAFEEPHRLCALHILMQGVLAIWASDPGDDNSTEARECLGIRTIPPSPNRGIASRSSIRQALGLKVKNSGTVVSNDSGAFYKGIACELGVKDLSGELHIKTLVDSIITGDATTSPSFSTVIDGFKALDRMFKKQ